MKRRFLIFVLLFCFLFSFVSCKKEQNKATVKSKTFFTYFDTAISVFSYADESQEQFEQNCGQIEAIFDKYNRLFDIYHEYSGITNLCTVNKYAGEPIVVDSAIINLLMYAKECYYITNGEVNVMLGPVLKLWKESTPTDNMLNEAAKHCNIENLIIDENSNTVLIADNQAIIDVGAIAKGYATEKVAEFLIQQGITSYIINAGGNVRLVGEKPGEKNWNVAISNPDKDSGEYVAVLQLHDTSCVTSGMYERPNHIIDKDTLEPPTYFASVSVIAKNSAYADALSTALFCMSYEDGLKLRNTLGDFDAIWLTNDGANLYTEGVKQFLNEDK